MLQHRSVARSIIFPSSSGKTKLVPVGGPTILHQNYGRTEQPWSLFILAPSVLGFCGRLPWVSAGQWFLSLTSVVEKISNPDVCLKTGKRRSQIFLEAIFERLKSPFYCQLIFQFCLSKKHDSKQIQQYANDIQVSPWVFRAGTDINTKRHIIICWESDNQCKMRPIND